MFIAFLYLRYTVPIYNASTIIQISKSNKAQEVLDVGLIYEDNSLSGEIELIRSKFLIRKAVNNLPLEISYFVKGDVLNDEKYGSSAYTVEIVEIKDSSIIGKPIILEFMSDGYLNIEIGNYSSEHEFLFDGLINSPKISFYIKYKNRSHLYRDDFTNTYFFIINNPTLLVNKFYKGLDVTVLNPNAQTIMIAMKYSNARLAMDFVDELAKQYILFDLEKKSQSSKSILQFINIQLDTVFQELNNTELMLQSFKKEHKVTNIENISNMYVENYGRLEDELFGINLEARVLDQIWESGLNENDIELYNLIPLLTGTNYGSTLSEMISSMHDLELRKEEYLYTGTVENERVEAINYQLSIQKRLLFESIENLRKRLKNKQETLENKIAEYEDLFVNMPTQEMEYTRLKRLYQINEKYYTLLLQKQIEYRISKAGFVTNNQVLEPAVMPGAPISPKKNVVYISFIVVAFIISIIFIIIRYLTHNNITSINEINRLSYASIGTLGIVPKYVGDMPDSMLLVDKNPKSVLAESFRSIRSNLQFVNNSPDAKLISITSTISGEGKTFIAINLGAIISFSNKKVIILDLDMRRPKIHKAFGVENMQGMSSLLIGKANIKDCIRKTRLEDLDFISAGPIPPNPSELLLNDELEKIIEELKKKYDYIITDNPPVGLVTDGIVLIQKADFPIYVFRADYSKKQFVQNVDRLKNENHIHRLSVILNSVDVNRNRYGYNYGYGYGYGYGYSYGYYEEKKKKKSKRSKVKN
jgi:capsular exopolysaccharide synthesis family protein